MDRIRFAALPDVVSARYDARGILGAGGMAVVQEALDRVLDRRVAIKLVRWTGDGREIEATRARFRREARAVARLSHPGIILIHDCGEDLQGGWIVMELIEGGSLKEAMERRGRFAAIEAARLTSEILTALDYAHRHGVVHRDMKPANIMLGLGGVKLADFGIAQLEDSTKITEVGTVMGTAAYMSPEQITGSDVDARADIWSVGVMLYELLTGERPFVGSSSSIHYKVMNVEPAPPSRIVITVPISFD